MQNIILIGMPGCGKTTIGKLLAKKLNVEFKDSDKVFTENVCPNISEYFAKYGEDSFRCEETKILRQLSRTDNCIIATGGGVVERTENKKILRDSGIVVFINRSPENIVGDVDTESRPLLKDSRNRIFDLYERRILKYKDFCDIEIENSGALDALTDKIINEVTRYNG